MRFLILVAAFSVAPAVIAEQTQRPDWNLQVGLFGYRPDGTISTMAFETQLSSRSFVYITEGLCGLGAGLGPRSRNATHAWAFTGKEIDVTPELAIIQLDWQRVIENGQPTTTPGGSVQLTLQAGERVTLDSVLPHHAASCWSMVGFEVRYRANPSPLAQLIVGPDGTPRSGGGDLVAPSGAPTPNPPVTSSSYDVHLWLVRSAPGRPEESQYRQIRFDNTRAPFSFAPITIDTPRGPVSVAVGGWLGVKTGREGEHLLLVMHRTVPRLDGGRTYSESQVSVVPAREKVLSFEMPPISFGDEQFPDRLSLRVRVEPR